MASNQEAGQQTFAQSGQPNFTNVAGIPTQAVQPDRSAPVFQVGPAPQYFLPAPQPRLSSVVSPALTRRADQTRAAAHATQTQNRPAAHPAPQIIDPTANRQVTQTPTETEFRHAAIQAPVIKGFRFRAAFGNPAQPNHHKPWDFFFTGELRIVVRMLGLEHPTTHVWSPCAREKYARNLGSILHQARFLNDTRKQQRANVVKKLYTYVAWFFGRRATALLAEKPYLIMWLLHIYTDARRRYVTAEREHSEQVRKENEMLEATYQDLSSETNRKCDCDRIYVAGHTVDVQQIRFLAGIDNWARSLENRIEASTFVGDILSPFPTPATHKQRGNPDAMREYEMLQEHRRKYVEQEKVRLENARKEGLKQAGFKQEDLKQEDVKQEDLKQEDVKQEDLKQEDLGPEDPTPDDPDPKQNYAKRHVRPGSGDDNTTHEDFKRIKKE